MEKTAVEWLIFHWMELDKKYYGGEIGRIDLRNRRDAIQVEANKMFEKQIIEASNESFMNGGLVKRRVKNKKVFSVGEQYYNETFKKQ
jgi:hypothetical protein